MIDITDDDEDEFEFQHWHLTQDPKPAPPTWPRFPAVGRRWSQRRLERLLLRYRDRYFPGRATDYTVTIEAIPVHLPWIGFCVRSERRIVIDPSAHDSDRKVRETLLHELAHAAQSDDDGHGRTWLHQIERLLAEGAPIRRRHVLKYHHELQAALATDDLPHCRQILERHRLA